MHQPGKSIPPHGGKPRDLSFPGQRDLTPEEAERVLKPQQPRQPQPLPRPQDEDHEDPVSTGRSGLEMVFYGIMLIAVVGFQLLSYYEPGEDGDVSLFDNPRVTAVTVNNRVEDSVTTLRGDRVTKPECGEGEVVIRTHVSEVEGATVGRIRTEAESINGEWRITATGLLAGYARVHAEAEVDCR